MNSLSCDEARQTLQEFKRAVKVWTYVVAYILGVTGAIVWIDALIHGLYWANVVGVIGLVLLALCVVLVVGFYFYDLIRAWRLVRKCNRGQS